MRRSNAAKLLFLQDRLKETPSIEEWLSKTVVKGEAVGINPFVYPLGAARRLATAMEKIGASLRPLGGPDLVDRVWAELADTSQHGAEAVAPQPAVPSAPVFVHPLQYAGVSASDKLASVRAALAAEGAAALVVTALDEIAWLLNIRGADIQCNPVALAYAVVPASAGAQAVLCMDAGKVTPAVAAHLHQAGVFVQPYDAVLDVVRSTAAAAAAAAAAGGGPAARVWLDPASCNYAIYQAALGEAAPTTADGKSAATNPNASSRVLEKTSPITLAKSLKNPAEIEGLRQAHLRDAVALVTFFSWLEAAVTRGVDLRKGPDAPLPTGFALTEYSAGAVLDGMRAEQPGYVSLSFPTIAGMGPNGAIIHYRAEEATAATITADSVFLCDSGGQYVDGTTDVTRTLHFGQPTAHQRKAYTLVLQGHIALSNAIFPTGTNGIALDTLARVPLWTAGLDYRHGTGHGEGLPHYYVFLSCSHSCSAGVGAFLNVHEGPQGASPQQRNTYDGGVVASMTLTDEPGYYEDGAFGIRIENVLVAKEAATPFTFGGKPYLCFEPITLVPISTKLVDVGMLSSVEKQWLNSYHAAVRAALQPRLSGHALEWMLRETESVA
jgi:Xaa-Pro aminopeptidase